VRFVVDLEKVTVVLAEAGDVREVSVVVAAPLSGSSIRLGRATEGARAPR
jgi:hypothetical protein